MKGNLINKELFLKAITCPTMAWRETHLTAPKTMSIYDKFIIDDGLDILVISPAVVGPGYDPCLRAFGNEHKD